MSRFCSRADSRASTRAVAPLWRYLLQRALSVREALIFRDLLPARRVLCIARSMPDRRIFLSCALLLALPCASGCRIMLAAGDRAPDAAANDAGRDPAGHDDADAGSHVDPHDAGKVAHHDAAASDASDDAGCVADVCPADAGAPPVTTSGARIAFTPVVVTAEMEHRATDHTLAPPATDLPSGAWSLKTRMSSIKDQGARATSATFAATAVAELYVGGDLSEQCTIREIGGNTSASAGSRFDLFDTRGSIAESACAYHVKLASAHIPADFDYDTLADQRGSHALLEYEHWSLPSSSPDALAVIKRNLRAGHPTTVNLLVPDHTLWFASEAESVIDVPSPLTCHGAPLVNGSTCDTHTTVIVGYDDADATFLVRNAWGDAWKEGGYGKLRYDYFRRLAFGDLDGLRLKFAALPPARADFDGDGHADLMIVDDNGSFLYRGRADGSLEPNAWVRSDLARDGVNYVPGDFDGDGRSDAIIETPSGSYLYLGKSDGTFTANAWVRNDLRLGHQRYVTGDFNGDGRSDFVITNLSGSYWYLGKADGTFEPNVVVRRDLTLGQVSYTSGDFNCDKRTDLIIVTPSGSYLYSGRADGTFDMNIYVRSDLPLGRVHHTPGDFNGDGCTDLIMTTDSGSYIYAGKPEGGFSPNIWVRRDLTLSNTEYTVADFDGDKKSDALIVNPSGTYLYRGSDSGLTGHVYARSDLPLASVRYFPSDFDGDGRDDVMIWNETGSYLYRGAADDPFVLNAYVRADLTLLNTVYF